MTHRTVRLPLVLSAVLLASVATSAIAQSAPPAPSSADAAAAPTVDGDEIVVNARRRDETSLEVPVTLTAVSIAEMSRRGINSIDGISKLVPSLVAGEAPGTLQGGIVTIRGISGAETNFFGEQAVSFNVDGVQVARAAIRRAATMDLQQVEVLKGPQALFFGKNSPAGIISIRTADPTPSLAAGITAGYEINAHEYRADGFISAPLTDTLGFRVAGYFSDMRGWVHNLSADVPASANTFPNSSRYTPNQREWALRGTLKWEPSDRFNARLKVTYDRIRADSISDNAQVIYCALGVPQDYSPLEDCKANDRTVTGALGPNFNKLNPLFPADGQGYYNQDQFLAGLEANYKLSDTLTLSSITGLYTYHAPLVGSFSYNYIETGLPVLGTTPPAGTPVPVRGRILASYNNPKLREVSEELRLTTNFKGPVNFLLGGHFQDTHATIQALFAGNALNPVSFYDYFMEQNGRAYSIFLQGSVDLLPTVQISLGGRYSHETKDLPQVLQSKAATPAVLEPFIDPTLIRHVAFNNLSPEFTARWRPTSQLTVYASYKEGFLSGGFNGNNPAVGTRLDYDQQLTKGFEGGVKAALLDGALRTNLALYSYLTTGLQVSVTVNGTQTELRNVGSVRTKGVEFDFTYRTPLEGLRFNGAANYNRGRYGDYQASCYRGQPSETCFLQVSRTTGRVALLQDLSGGQLGRAPKFTGNLGFDYETPVFSGFKLGFAGGVTHSSGYFSSLANTPASYRKAFNLFDASVRLLSADDRWQLALIGQNLTEKWVYARASDVPFTGTAPGTRSAADPLRLLGDVTANPGRGRQILIQASYKFGG